MRLLSAALLLSMAYGLPGHATPFNGQTISNVTVNGTAYNVSFTDTAFAALPAAQQAPAFTTLASAVAALNAIVSRPEYATLAALANPSANPYTSIVVPFSGVRARNAFSGDTVVVFEGVGIAQPAPTFPNQYQPPNYELDANVNYAFAGISLTSFTAVPEPASLAVLAVGLIGAGLLRRRG